MDAADCYFGVDTLCEQEDPQNAVKLTYIGTPDSNGDPYRGLDRGACPVRAGRRVIDQRWHKGTTKLERLDYTYSRLGNRTERDNTVAATGQDEKYDGACPGGTGDGLYRLGNMGRGTFTSGTLNKDFEQDWGGACPVLAGNPLGNWKNFKQGDGGATWDLDQTRAHTKVNAIEVRFGVGTYEIVYIKNVRWVALLVMPPRNTKFLGGESPDFPLFGRTGSVNIGFWRP